jgi:hypothetical protein
MLDAQNVLWETGRVALWTARGASDRNMMGRRGNVKQRDSVDRTVGMTGVNGWGTNVELFLQAELGRQQCWVSAG